MAHIGGWLQSNWFNLVQTASIVAGLLFTGSALRRETRSKSLSCLLAIKKEHRELWNTVYARPELSRVLKEDADLVGKPMTHEEDIFLRQLIVHVATAWRLIQEGTPLDTQALLNDVAKVFSTPLPRAAWEHAKSAQDPLFADFIDTAIKSSN